jgi:hypothetical protein
LYGGKYHLSFMAKLFYGLSLTKPFEEINTWCYPDIFEHLVTRTADQMHAIAFATFSNGGAMVFIDAVNPDGTIHKKNYLTLGKIYQDLAQFEPYAGGKFIQDIGIYFSSIANFDLAENGKDTSCTGTNKQFPTIIASPSSHRSAALNLSQTLVKAHLPYGILTKKDLHRLSDFQVIVLPNMIMMDPEEIEAVRAYVANGGSLFASKNTSLISHEGIRQADFMLSDLFGVSYLGETKECLTYIRMAPKFDGMFEPYSRDWPLTLYDTQLLVKAHADTQILATITLPYTDPTSTQYASMLTSPPEKDTGYPALVLHPYGKGQVIYASGVPEIWEHDSQTRVLTHLIRSLASQPWQFETDAPKPVEITIFHQEDKKRFILHVLNYQQELPNLPIFGIHVKVWLDQRQPGRVLLLPKAETMPFSFRDGQVQFEIARLDDYCMVAIEYT